MTLVSDRAKLGASVIEEEIAVMTIRYRQVCLLTAMILLAGCAQNREVPKLTNQVVELKQVLGELTEQATALERQNRLNQNSNSGVYLLPAANNAAKLQSSVGELSLSLNYVKSEANGSQAILYVRTLSGQYLPGFTATLEWGQLDAATGMPLSAQAQSQQIQSASSLLPKTEQIFELRLSGVTPSQLGYVRVHSVEPITQR
jgi:outer membrane murein-binding lipoprotein Lpp